MGENGNERAFADLKSMIKEEKYKLSQLLTILMSELADIEEPFAV